MSAAKFTSGPWSYAGQGMRSEQPFPFEQRRPVLAEVLCADFGQETITFRVIGGIEQRVGAGTVLIVPVAKDYRFAESNTALLKKLKEALYSARSVIADRLAEAYPVVLSEIDKALAEAEKETA